MQTKWYYQLQKEYSEKYIKSIRIKNVIVAKLMKLVIVNYGAGNIHLNNYFKKSI